MIHYGVTKSAQLAISRGLADITMLACPHCGGQLRLVATVEDPSAIRAILASGGLSAERLDRAPPSVVETTATHARKIGA